MSSEAESDTTARVDATLEQLRHPLASTAAVIDELEQELTEFRRDIHRHPELSWKETRTTEKIVAVLEQAGLSPQRLPESTGLYVDVGDPEAPLAAAFRADIDALPIRETTGLPYASENEGVAHACGHDIHTTVMLGVALARHRLHQRSATQDSGSQDRGSRIRVIFQPAEEHFPGGAQEVVKQGVLEGVPRIFALHCDPKLTVGRIGTRIGAITSASDLVRIHVTGRGGHTSRPHLTEDVVGALGHLATVVPAVLTRRIDSRSGVSLVWGHIQAGSAANAIPAEGTLHGTMRVLDAQAWKEAGEVLGPVVKHAVAAYGVDVSLDHVRGVPPVINEEGLTALIENAAKRSLGDNCLSLAEQSMGGEDFGWMAQEVPGSMFRLGTKTPDGESYDLHRGDYTPDEEAITVGVTVMTAVAEAAVDDVVSGP